MNPRRQLQEWLGAGIRNTSLIVVFTDIIGSSKLCMELGNERWIEILIQHFARARLLMEAYDCCEIKIIGDSFMLAFRTAVEALNFSLAYQKDTGHPRVRIRAGIHAGTVRIIDNDIYGTMVNYASRVASWVDDEGIALSSTAKEQVDDEIGSQVSALLFVRYSARFKGFDKTQRVWRVDPGMWWRVRNRQPLPDLDDDARENPRTPKFRLIQATPSDVEWIALLEADTYSAEDAIPLKVLQKWFRANPDGFSVLVDQDGTKIGHLDILPLRSETVGSFLRGLTSEREIPPEALYRPSERPLIRDLYVESIIIQPAKCLSGAPAILHVLSGFAGVVERICELTQVRDVYAIAASTSGARLLQRVGFSVKTPAGERIDGHDLFGIPFNDLVANIQALLGPNVVLPAGFESLAADGL